MLPTIARPRLVEELTASTRPIITVVAPAGAGKSVLLQQLTLSFAEHGAAPIALVSCTESDRDRSSLLAKIERSIAAALHHGVDDPSDAARPSGTSSAVELAERFGGRARLLFDDVHRLGAADDATAVVDGLLYAAPEIGRVVVASRVRVPNLARLRAGGFVHDLEPGLLAFTEDECLALTGRRTRTYGGWPALVALDASAGVAGVEEYLSEQVVGSLGPGARTVLAAAAVIGGGDRELLGEALGRPVRNEELEELADLPSVDLAKDPDTGRTKGELVLHPVYSRLLSKTVGAEDRCRLVTIGAKRFMLTDPDRSARLLLDSIESNDLSHSAGVWSRLGYSDVPRQVLAGLAGAAASAVSSRTNPDLAMLRGLLRRTADPTADEAIEMLDLAAVGFAEQGRWADVIVAESELGFAHRISGRTEAMASALHHVTRLAERLDGNDRRDVQARVLMANAVLADQAGADAEVVRNVKLLEEELLPHRYGCSAHFLGMFCALQVGDGLEAVRFAELYVQTAPADRVWAWHLPLVAAWHGGMPWPAETSLPGSDHFRSGNPVDRIWAAASVGLLAAFRGDIPAAIEAVSAARSACPERAMARIRSILVSTEVALAVADGREDDAGRAIGECLAILRTQDGLQPDEGRGLVRNLHWCLAVVYVLAPELRSILDQLPLAPPLATKRQAGQLMVAVKAGDRIELGDRSAEELDALVAALPVRWAAALAAELNGQRSPDAGRLTDAVVGIYGEAARIQWRSGGGASKRLARTVPVQTGHHVEINMLGPLLLRIGGVEVTGEPWARDRVRALLALLAHNRSMQRDEVMVALWPDLDDEAGRRNLRVTLSYLRSLLEPGRVRGEASFYIRSEGDRIWLVDHCSVTTDVDRFDRLLDQAGELDASDEPDAAFDRYQEAIGLWRGDCLCRYAYDDWPQVTATRLRNRYVDACLTAGRHLIGCARSQAAIGMAERAIAAEPWSEPAYALLIEAQLRGGNRAGALRTVATHQALCQDLGVEAGPLVTELIAPLGPPGLAVAFAGKQWPVLLSTEGARRATV